MLTNCVGHDSGIMSDEFTRCAVVERPLVKISCCRGKKSLLNRSIIDRSHVASSEGGSDR